MACFLATTVMISFVMQMTASPRYAFMEPRTAVPSEVVLNKLEELSKSVKVRNYNVFSL